MAWAQTESCETCGVEGAWGLLSNKIKSVEQDRSAELYCASLVCEFPQFSWNSKSPDRVYNTRCLSLLRHMTYHNNYTCFCQDLL